MRSMRVLPWVATTLLVAMVAGCGLPSTPLSSTSSRTVTAQDGGWLTYPDAPTARFKAAGAAIGFSLFVLGGRTKEGVLAKSEIFRAFDRWSVAPAMPTPRSGLAAVVVPADRVLAVGGENATGALGTAELYSFDKGTWETLPAMPTKRSCVAAAAYGVFAYVVGGKIDGKPGKTVEVLDIRDKSWKTVAPLSVAREGAIAARLGERMAVVGGHNAAGPLGTLELYHFEKNTWTTMAPMPTPREEAAYAVVGHHLFVMGGETAQGPTTAVESYDLASNTWTKRAPLPVAIVGGVGSKLGERIVITGGVAGEQLSTKTFGLPIPL